MSCSAGFTSAAQSNRHGADQLCCAAVPDRLPGSETLESQLPAELWRAAPAGSLSF